MRVLVCGSRTPSMEQGALVRKALYELSPKPTAIIHGGCSGADAAAHFWAIDNEVPVEKYPADWKTHGNAAGPIRNQRMIDEGKPDLVLAFPGGRGTEDMVRRAVRAGVEVRRV